MNEAFQQVNWGLIVPLFALQLILVIVALSDCIRSERTNGPKWMWALIIVFGNILGLVAYFVFGRRNS